MTLFLCPFPPTGCSDWSWGAPDLHNPGRACGWCGAAAMTQRAAGGPVPSAAPTPGAPAMAMACLPSPLAACCKFHVPPAAGAMGVSAGIPRATQCSGLWDSCGRVGDPGSVAALVPRHEDPLVPWVARWRVVPGHRCCVALSEGQARQL